MEEEKGADMMNKQILRAYVRGIYGRQKLRVSMGNRLVINFKTRLEQKPTKKEDTLGTEALRFLNTIRLSYKRLTEGVLALPRHQDFQGDEVISSYAEMALVHNYLNLEATEAEGFKQLLKMVREFPVWTEFLERGQGVGPAMAGLLISEIDIGVSRYPSSLCKYAGLDVAGDGQGRRRR